LSRVAERSRLGSGPLRRGVLRRASRVALHAVAEDVVDADEGLCGDGHARCCGVLLDLLRAAMPRWSLLRRCQFCSTRATASWAFDRFSSSAIGWSAATRSRTPGRSRWRRCRTRRLSKAVVPQEEELAQAQEGRCPPGPPPRGGPRHPSPLAGPGIEAAGQAPRPAPPRRPGRRRHAHRPPAASDAAWAEFARQVTYRGIGGTGGRPRTTVPNPHRGCPTRSSGGDHHVGPAAWAVAADGSGSPAGGRT
jgi:hypothetical protein